jgi:hypothetical protein
MTDTSPATKYPATWVSQNSSPAGLSWWDHTGVDISGTTCDMNGPNDNVCCYRTRSGNWWIHLLLSTWGFNLPPDAIIDLITGNIKGTNTSGLLASESVTFAKGSNSVISSGPGGGAQCSDSYFPITEEVSLGPLGLTVNDLNTDNFTCTVEGSGSGLQSKTVWVDAVRIIVNFHVPSPSTGGILAQIMMHKPKMPNFAPRPLTMPRFIPRKVI